MNQRTTSTSCRSLTFIVTLLLLIYLTETAYIRKHHLKRKAINANVINEYVVCRKVLTNHVLEPMQTAISQHYKRKANTETAVEICEPLSFFPIKTSCGKINCDMRRSHRMEEDTVVARTAFNDIRPASFYPYVRSNINPPAKSHHHGFSDDVLCDDRVRERLVSEASEIDTFQAIQTMNCPLDGPSIPISRECVAGPVCIDGKTYENHEKHCQFKVREVITCTEINGIVHNKTVYVHNGCNCKLVPKSDSITNIWN